MKRKLWCYILIRYGYYYESESSIMFLTAPNNHPRMCCVLIVVGCVGLHRYQVMTADKCATCGTALLGASCPPPASPSFPVRHALYIYIDAHPRYPPPPPPPSFPVRYALYIFTAHLSYREASLCYIPPCPPPCQELGPKCQALLHARCQGDFRSQ